SMVSNSDFKDLQTIVSASNNSRCAYVGDIAQLSPVESGKPSELAYIAKEADISIATMNQVLRQKNPELKSIAQDLMQGTENSIKSAFEKLDKQNFIKENEAPIEKIAKDYCALGQDEQKNTLVAIATNANRTLANELIRDEMKQSGVLSGLNITVNSLQDSRLTNIELKQSQHYQAGDILKVDNSYGVVSQVDHKSNCINLKTETENRIVNLSMVPSDKPLELFKNKQIELQQGDRIKWTKSDRNRNITAHDLLQVSSIDNKNKIIEAIDEAGAKLNIDLKQKQNQHIDYSYTSTVHGLQGATAKNVMILIDSKNKQSNTARLMYVAATRATDKALLYTDDKAAITRQISINKGEKNSALDAMGLLDKKKKEATQVKPQENNAKQNYKPQLDAKIVETKMRDGAQNICLRIFGEPNKSLSSANNWRYGKKGSLSIIVGGNHQGSFHNFETGEKGGMIQLLKSELGLDFKSALEEGNKILGGDNSQLGLLEKVIHQKESKGVDANKS
ncbi:MAG: AAA family ATPase, partial [Candidatus Thioglobus sp.]